jgi:hypothetical protein
MTSTVCSSKSDGNEPSVFIVHYMWALPIPHKQPSGKEEIPASQVEKYDKRAEPHSGVENDCVVHRIGGQMVIVVRRKNSVPS